MNRYDVKRKKRIEKISYVCNESKIIHTQEFDLRIGNFLDISFFSSKIETGLKMFKVDTLKTKSFWAGIAMVAWGVYQLSQGEPGAENKIMVGIGLIVGRDALSKIEKK